MPLLFAAGVALSANAAAQAPDAGGAASAQDNPLFKPFDTIHGTVPFSKINNNHWMPAIDRGIKLAKAEIDAIVSNPQAPTFVNTIVALEHVGADLDRVLGIFYNLCETDADDEMMNIMMDATGKLSDYSTSIILNEGLWKRVKAVYDNRANLKLTPEQQTLLQRTYDGFALEGATLEGQDRDTYKKLSAELSQLTTRFGQNVQKEMPTYKMFLKKEDLSGLPEDVVKAAAENATKEGREGEYMFTLDAPVYMAFMKYADRRDLREKMWRLYTGRNTKGEYDNTEVIKRIADVRRQIANLLGSKTYAEQSLKTTMAKSPEAVYRLLGQLRDAYAPAAKAELDTLNTYASRIEGKPFQIKNWDYSYYSNKHRAERHAFDEEALRPYFELSNVIDGVFGLATRLYGLHFKKNPDIEVYHPEVNAYEVTDNDGKFIGVLYTDFFPRATKRPGAWMTNFKEQWKNADGTDSRPLVSIVMNFTKPTADKPSLLTPYEVETFLHEFGHSLHGLMASGTYKSLSGTNVYRDFVELPSQFNENFLYEREFLDSFAKHYKTGEPIPDNLVKGLVSSSQYGSAYACMRQLMFGYLDMAWHTITAPVADAAAFEAQAVAPVEMFPPQPGSMTSAQFSHIFAGGYAAGYYSYKWAEVLDADAFAAFKEEGIFNPATAKRFHDEVLVRGGSVDPAELYRNFRGRDATIDALLIRDGIKDAPKVSVPQLPKD